MPSGRVQLRWRDRDGTSRSRTVEATQADRVETELRDALSGRMPEQTPAPPAPSLPPIPEPGRLTAAERARLPRDAALELSIVELQGRLDTMTNGAAFVAGTRLLTQLRSELEELRRPPPADPLLEAPEEELISQAVESLRALPSDLLAVVLLRLAAPGLGGAIELAHRVRRSLRAGVPDEALLEELQGAVLRLDERSRAAIGLPPVVH